MPRKSKEEEVKEKTQSIDDLDSLRGYGVSAQMIERLRAVGVTSPKHLLLFNATVDYQVGKPYFHEVLELINRRWVIDNQVPLEELIAINVEPTA